MLCMPKSFLLLFRPWASLILTACFTAAPKKKKNKKKIAVPVSQVAPPDACGEELGKKPLGQRLGLLCLITREDHRGNRTMVASHAIFAIYIN